MGRRRNLETFERLWSAVRRGSGRGLVVTGEAGIGKSRLINEFLTLGFVDEGSVVTCQILPQDLGLPFRASTRIVQSLLAGQFEMCEPVCVSSLGQLYKELGMEGRFVLAATLEILGLQEQEQEAAWADLEPSERLDLVVQTVGQLVAMASRRKPLVLVMEDFHWADSETRSLASELGKRIGDSRLLLVLSSRERTRNPWSVWPETKEIEIQPFSRSQSSELLEGLLGSDAALDELKELLTVKTQGNPFFLNECVRALEDSGVLVRHARVVIG